MVIKRPLHICFDYLVLISSERVLRESGRCRRIVRRPGPGSPGVVTFCALNHYRFLKASLFGSFMAFLMRNHTTFVIKFRFAMGRDFGYIKGLAGTMSSRLTSDIVHVLLDLLLLRPLFHLAVTFFVLAAFIFINLAIKKSNGENIHGIILPQKLTTLGAGSLMYSQERSFCVKQLTIVTSRGVVKHLVSNFL